MGNTSKTQPISKRDLYYYRARQKNRVFADLCDFYANEAENTGMTKRAMAEKIGCDPALITRWLSAPSNLTLDTISDLLLSLGAEMDCRIVKFNDRPRPNDAHPLTYSLRIFDDCAKTSSPKKSDYKVIDQQIDQAGNQKTKSSGTVKILEPT